MAKKTTATGEEQVGLVSTAGRPVGTLPGEAVDNTESLQILGATAANLAHPVRVSYEGNLHTSLYEGVRPRGTMKDPLIISPSEHVATRKQRAWTATANFESSTGWFNFSFGAYASNVYNYNLHIFNIQTFNNTTSTYLMELRNTTDIGYHTYASSVFRFQRYVKATPDTFPALASCAIGTTPPPGSLVFIHPVPPGAFNQNNVPIVLAPSASLTIGINATVPSSTVHLGVSFFWTEV